MNKDICTIRYDRTGEAKYIKSYMLCLAPVDVFIYDYKGKGFISTVQIWQDMYIKIESQYNNFEICLN